MRRANEAKRKRIEPNFKLLKISARIREVFVVPRLLWWDYIYFLQALEKH